MRILRRIIWNCLAVIGLIAVLSTSCGFLLLMHRTDLNAENLARKIINKSLVFVFPKYAESQTEPPKVNSEDYPPVALSPHVSTTPIDESLLINRRILRVGPQRSLKLPSEAAKIAKAGDIIEIDAGDYVGDSALWGASQITIRGIGGRAVLNAGGASYNGKAIWVITGDHVLVDNIGFENCKVRDRNGAGIRVEGDDLKVRNCLFRNNENGILGGSLKNVHRLTVEYSEFGFNGHGDGQSHGIYIGAIDEFIFSFNYLHHTKSGHHVKSRARLNKILYNYLTDHEDGNASYAIDLPDGGKSFVIGNYIHQSKYTENSALIHYGMPKSQKGQTFYIVNNTVSSSRHTGIFVHNHSPAEGIVVNNLLFGKLQLATGQFEEKHNRFVKGSCFIPDRFFPFAVQPDCSSIDSGIFMENSSQFDLMPRYEYVHPLTKHTRRSAGQIDVGAFEYNPN